MSDFGAALDRLAAAGVLAFIDAMAAREGLTAIMRPQDAPRLTELLPHATPALHDPTGPPRTTTPGHMVVDCRPPSASSAPATLPSLFEDAVACFLTGAPQLLPPDTPPGPRYYLLSTPRSGSTFLCDLLTRAGQLGTPTEHLKSWLKPYLLEAGLRLTGLLDRLHGHACSANGVFATKIIINDLFDLVPEFADDLLGELRRHPVFVLVRGDKAAQALSNVRSNRLSIYHLDPSTAFAAAETLAAFEADPEDILDKERWLLRQEADLLDLLRQHHILPALLSYETCVQSRQGAETMMQQVAKSLDITWSGTLGWPDLVRIGSVAPSTDLARYQAMRLGIQLFSTRSEPWLGTLLGDGWRAPERWGVRSQTTQAELRIPPGLRPRAIELLIALEDGDGAQTISLGGVMLAVPDAGTGRRGWRCVARLDDGVSVMRLALSRGAISLEEVLLFAAMPPWHERRLHGRMAMLELA